MLLNLSEKIWCRVIFLLLLGLWSRSLAIAQEKPTTITYELPVWRFPVADTPQINAWYLEAIALEKNNKDSALSLLRQVLGQSRKIKYLDGIARAMLAISTTYGRKGDYAMAMKVHKEAFSNYIITGKPKYIFRFYEDMGNYYEQLGFKDTAIQYFHIALQKLNQYPDIDSAQAKRWSLYHALASVYATVYATYGQNDFASALYYLEKAEQIALSRKDKEQLIQTYIIWGATYANRAAASTHDKETDFRKGMYFLKRAIAMGHAEHITKESGTAYSNLGTIYVNLGILDSGERYIQKALDLVDTTLAITRGRIRPYLVLGAAFFKRKNYPKAEKYFLKAGAEAKTANSRTALLEIYQNLTHLYIEYKQYYNALAYQQNYALLRDSLLNEEKIKITLQLELKYKAAEKDKEITQHKLNFTHQQNKIREQYIWILAAGSSTLLLAGLLMALYRNSRHRRKLQEEKINSIEQQQEIKGLKAMMQGEEKERARLARELHDGIVGQLAAVKLNLSDIQDNYPVLQQAKDFEEALNQLDDAALDLRKTAHNLMPEILLQQGLTDTLAIFCERMSKRAGLSIHFQLIGTLPSLDTVAALSLYRMVQEMVQNIIKHAHATEAIVQINCHDNSLLLLTVEDNGIGIPPSIQELETTLKTVSSRVNQLSGQLDIQSRSGKGTNITLSFNLEKLKV